MRAMASLFRYPLLASVVVGLGLILIAPGLAIYGRGHYLLPCAVHLLTVGGILGGAYELQHRIWAALYGSAAPWPPLLAAVWVFHVPGMVLLVWGFCFHDTLAAYIGGHYLVPTGIVLGLIHGWVAAWRRPPGTPRQWAAHLPGLGLALAVSLGALLVMEARLLRYDIYTPDTIFMHLMAAGFLFVVPLLLLPELLAAPFARDSGPSSAALLRWYAATAVAAGGVFTVALALAPDGARAALPLGLGLLGALLVWIGLPERLPARRVAWQIFHRAGRLAVGVLLLHAAIRLLRGADMAELLMLSKLGVLLFITALALPELLRHLGGAQTAATAAPWGVLSQLLMLGGAALMAGGQYWVEPALLRAGAAGWLAGLLVWGSPLPGQHRNNLRTKSG